METKQSKLNSSPIKVIIVLIISAFSFLSISTLNGSRIENPTPLDVGTEDSKVSQQICNEIKRLTPMQEMQLMRMIISDLSEKMSKNDSWWGDKAYNMGVIDGGTIAGHLNALGTVLESDLVNIRLTLFAWFLTSADDRYKDGCKAGFKKADLKHGDMPESWLVPNSKPGPAPIK